MSTTSTVVVPTLIALIVLITLGAVTRRRVVRTVERAYAMAFPALPSGVVAGAEGFALRGTTGRSLLLLHGSGDSPQSLRYLADRLNRAGYAVSVPLLPGHGRSPREFSTATAGQYMDAVRVALEELRDSTTWLGLIGLSMGGALGTQLAAEAPDLRVLVLLAPYLVPPKSVRWAARTSWLWSPIVPYTSAGGKASVRDVAARNASRAYGTFSAGALEALLDTADTGRRVLSQLTLPILVINSEQDNRIPRGNALTALKEMPSGTERAWVTGCGHLITVDYCKDAVAELVVDFLARHAD